MDEQKLLKRKTSILTKGTKLQLAEICTNLAELYSREERYEEALNEYQQQAELYKELDKKILYANANRMIGELYTKCAEFDKALHYGNIHLEIACQEHNDLEKQRALASIGRTHLTRAISKLDDNSSQSLNLALKSFSQSLKVGESLNDISKQEKMDMRARLLLNIGIVYENQLNYEKGIDYMQKAIQICKKCDIFDQLHQVYVALGLLYNKKEEYKNAINHFDMAITVADRLSDKCLPLFNSFVGKAESLIKIADFHTAKIVLLKAYKLKIPNIQERNIVKQDLKVVAAMCMAEDELLLTPNTDLKKKKKLYEKMGDGACSLRNYKKGIDYYQKMLECAQANGETGKELVPVYVSLAQTYKDDKNYIEAYNYFKLELNMHQNNPEEMCKTLLNIAEVMEFGGNTYSEIDEIYKKAKEKAEASGVLNLVGKATKQYALFQKKYKQIEKAAELENELIMMDYVESDDETMEDDAHTPDIGDDINISDLSDPDNDSNDEKSPNRASRRRGKTFKIKKNAKGETDLHVACIKGNIYLVNRLIDQGHPLNIRDNSGWLPIHEACNYGYLEIVRTLLDKGANINDRGGAGCDGVTPLHDACANGHLELIEFLLDRGASPLALTNNRETPLDILRNWRKDSDLDPITQTFYETIVSRMMSALEKAGRSINNKNTSVEPITAYELTPSSSRRSPRVTPNKSSPAKQKTPSKIGSLRNTVDIDDDLPSCSRFSHNSSPEKTSSFNSKRKQVTRNLDLPSDHESSDSDDSGLDDETGAGIQYKQVIEGLRTRFPEPKKSKKVKSKDKNKSGLLHEEEVGDDWLEDDIGINQAGRKRKRTSNLIETSGMRKSNSFGSTKNSTNSPTKSVIEMELNDQENLNNISQNALNNGYESSDSSNSNLSNKRRKSQSSLLDSGFSKRRSDSPLNLLNLNSSAVTCVSQISNKSYKRQQKLNSFVNTNNSEIDLTSQIDSSQLERSQYLNSTLSATFRSMLAVNVKIDGKLWRIPIPANDIDSLTIGWLAKEAAKRYYKKNGIEPTLQLETKAGAILENEDPLSLIFISPSQSEEINSVIISWNVAPLPERYIEACSNCKIDINKKIRDTLDECQATLKLKLTNFAIPKIQLNPLFRALNRQDNLQSIDFSGNSILNDGINQLCTVIPSLIQLKSLNLSLTNITAEGIRSLSNLFSNTNNTILQNLKELNLSYNSIGDESLPYLAIILKHVNLRILNLAACDFSENIFDHFSNHGLILNLEHLEYFDLSYNTLNKDSIVMFISFLNFNVINSLNFSNNSAVTESGITNEIVENLKHLDVINLKCINLERCKVNDAEVWELLRALLKVRTLDAINLSYNDDLTSVSLRRLLQHKPSFSSINLQGCTNIVDYLDQCTSITNVFEEMSSNSLKSLKLSFNYKKYCKEADMLISIWEKQWGFKSKIEKKFNSLLYLSVID